MKTVKKILIYLASAVIVIYLLRMMLLLGIRLVLLNEPVVPTRVMEKEAIWIARYWGAKSSSDDLQTVLSNIEVNHQCKIDHQSWLAVNSDSELSFTEDVVVYNTQSIDGRYLVVCKNLSVKWLKPSLNESFKKSQSEWK